MSIRCLTHHQFRTSLPYLSNSSRHDRSNSIIGDHMPDVYGIYPVFLCCCSTLDARGGGGRGVFFDRSEMLNADRLFLCLTCNSAVIMMNCPSCHVLKRPAIQFATAGFRSMREVFSFLVPHRKVSVLSSCFLYALDLQPYKRRARRGCSEYFRPMYYATTRHIPKGTLAATVPPHVLGCVSIGGV
jgi:hypothetical protein